MTQISATLKDLKDAERMVPSCLHLVHQSDSAKTRQILEDERRLLQIQPSCPPLQLLARWAVFGRAD